MGVAWLAMVAWQALRAAGSDCDEEEVNFRILLGDETGFMRYPAYWSLETASDEVYDGDGFGAEVPGDDGILESGNVTLDAGTDALLPPVCAAAGEYHLTVFRPFASCGPSTVPDMLLRSARATRL